MRSAKENHFPYTMSTVCYFEVDGEGGVTQVPHKNKSDRPRVLEAYQRAKESKTTLYAVWPGNWSSDLFVMDDLDAMARELGLI